MLYTPASYFREKKVSHEADGLKEQDVQTTAGVVRRIVVWEGPRDVWELDTEELSAVSTEAKLHDGTDVSAPTEQQEMYESLQPELLDGLNPSSITAVAAVPNKRPSSPLGHKAGSQTEDPPPPAKKHGGKKEKAGRSGPVHESGKGKQGDHMDVGRLGWPEGGGPYLGWPEGGGPYNGLL